MSPNPVSRLPLDDVPIFFGPYDGVSRVSASLTIVAAEIIAMWAYVANDMKALAAGMLHANAVAVSEILSAIGNARLRHNLIEAAAKEAIPEHIDTFEQVMRVVEPVGNVRHNLAHHIWGAAEARPDLLILVDPTHFARAHAESTARRARLLKDIGDRIAILGKQAVGSIFDDVSDMNVAPPRSPLPTIVPREVMFAYTRTELEDIRAEAGRAHLLLMAFEMLVNPSPQLGSERSPSDVARAILDENLPSQR